MYNIVLCYCLSPNRDEKSTQFTHTLTAIRLPFTAHNGFALLVVHFYRNPYCLRSSSTVATVCAPMLSMYRSRRQRTTENDSLIHTTTHAHNRTYFVRHIHSTHVTHHEVANKTTNFVSEKNFTDTHVHRNDWVKEVVLYRCKKKKSKSSICTDENYVIEWYQLHSRFRFRRISLMCVFLFDE